MSQIVLNLSSRKNTVFRERLCEQERKSSVKKTSHDFFPAFTFSFGYDLHNYHMLFTFLKPNPCTTFSMQFWMRNLMNYIFTYPQKLLYISVKNMPIISKARVTYIGIPESFCAFSRPLCAYDQAKPKIFYILPRRHEVLTLEGEEDLKV